MLRENRNNFQLPDVSTKVSAKHSSAALKQARRIKQDLNIGIILEGRKEVQGITIDSISSPDLDDAIHVEKLQNKGYRIFIHIASPTEIIPRNSPIEKDAFSKATSIYFGERHIYHMLPNVISTDISSLNEGEQRLTLTLEIELNRDFQVMNKDLYQSVFQSRKRHNPQSFTEGINNTAHSEYEYFSIMHELARGLREERENPYRIDRFDDADRRITMGERIYGHSNSHISSFVIQEFMILANRISAEIAQENSVNGIYRQHMPEFQDGRDLPKVLERAEYSGCPGFHTGLGVHLYSHFTSPIRRLADYVLHIQLLCMLSGTPEEYSKEKIQAICQYINFQIIALTGHQKNELLDMHGKRLVRKSKDKGDFRNVIHHITHRQSNGLKIPNSIREVILKKIHDTSTPLEDWIISRFIGNGEKEILQALCQRIKGERKVYKYLRILQNTGNVDFLEEEIESNNGKTLTFSIRLLVEGKEIMLFEESGDKISGLPKVIARTRGFIKLGKSFESMQRHDSHALQAKLKGKVRKIARDYYLDYLIQKSTKNA